MRNTGFHKFLALIIACGFFSVMVYAQENEEPVYAIVEEMPEFPGGQEAIAAYFGKNIIYPQTALMNGTEGVVYVQFVVDKTGEVKDIKVLRSLSKACDKESIRIINEMPLWKPGYQKKLPVNVSLTLPVKFSINSYQKLKAIEDSLANNNKAMIEESELFMVVEEPPSFPGGEDAMLKFMKENIEYPDKARYGTEGIVYISFIVTGTGEIIEAKILRGIGGGCDEEALRVVNMMPNWIPGKQQGKPVMVQNTLPVSFHLR